MRTKQIVLILAPARGNDFLLLLRMFARLEIGFGKTSTPNSELSIQLRPNRSPEAEYGTGYATAKWIDEEVEKP